MFNTKRKQMTDELEKINHQLHQLSKNVQNNKEEPSISYVISEDNDLKEMTQALNALILSYEKRYSDLSIKHEIVTHLNGIGTWDGAVYDGKMKPEDPNDYNSSFREQLGYAGEEDFPSILASWYQTVGDEDLDRVTEAYDALFTHDAPYDIEYRSKNKDESLEWVHVRADVLRNEAGDVIRHIGTLRNIHKDKMNEMKVQQLLERLELIESSLKMSTNNLEGAWGINFEKEEGDLERYWFSPQFISLLGYTNEEEFEPSMRVWTDLIVENEIAKQFDEFLNDNQDDLSLEFRMKTIDGDKKWFTMTLHIERDIEGEPLLLAGVLRDIQQEVKRLDEANTIGEDMKDFTLALNNLATQVQNISNEASEIADVNASTVGSSHTAKEKLDDTKTVTDLIKEISDKTNLLGINASIEASLSGEEGNGFQVIAKEIVNLSSETTNAVDQVEEILDEVSESVLEIVASIENITEKIDKQALYSKESNDATKIINEKANNLLGSIENLR